MPPDLKSGGHFCFMNKSLLLIVNDILRGIHPPKTVSLNSGENPSEKEKLLLHRAVLSSHIQLNMT